jgi:chromosomal replication initiation ATPase DnaA
MKRAVERAHAITTAWIGEPDAELRLAILQRLDADRELPAALLADVARTATSVPRAIGVAKRLRAHIALDPRPIGAARLRQLATQAL